MSLPTIGELRRRITLERYLDSPDDTGGFIRTFAPLARLWAKIERQGAQTQFIEQRLEETRNHIVTIRWRGDVTSQMRFSISDRKLTILSIEDPDGTRRYLQCMCQEIL